MVQERVQYVCELCQKAFNTREDAENCESRCQLFVDSPGLEVLNLSTRTYNALNCFSLYSVHDIAQLSEKDFEKIKGFGRCLKEVKAKLAEYGIPQLDTSVYHQSKEDINKIIPNKNIGKDIALHRKRLGLSQAKLASIVGMDDNHLSCIKIGLKYPRINTIARLAVALEVSINDLTDGK